MAPWKAGIINAVIPGLGYILIRKRVLFGQLLLLSTVAAIALVFVEPDGSPYSSAAFYWAHTTTGKFLESLWMFATAVALGYDAYTEAENDH